MSHPCYLTWEVVLLLGQQEQRAGPAGVQRIIVEVGLLLQAAAAKMETMLRAVDARQEAWQETDIAKMEASLQRSARPDQRNRIPLSIPTWPEKEC